MQSAAAAVARWLAEAAEEGSRQLHHSRLQGAVDGEGGGWCGVVRCGVVWCGVM